MKTIYFERAYLYSKSDREPLAIKYVHIMDNWVQFYSGEGGVEKECFIPSSEIEFIRRELTPEEKLQNKEMIESE